MTDLADDLELQKFFKACNYIQEFTRRLLERGTKNPIQIPDNLSGISQLTTLVRQYIREQQELAASVEKVNEAQKNFTDHMKQKSICKCEAEMNMRKMLTQQIRLEDIRRDDGTNFSLKLPSTSSPEATSNMNVFDPDILKVFSAPFTQNDLYHQLPHTSNSMNHHHQENGNGFSNISDPQQFFDSSPPNSEKRKAIQNGQKSKKRPHEMSTIGPYPCQHCDKVFRQKHGLSQHLLTHESVGAFECDGCGKRYSRQESVYRHQRSTQCCAKYLSLQQHDGRPDDSKPNIQQLLSSPHSALFIQ